MAIVSYVLFKLNWSPEFEWIWATSSMMRAVNQVGIDRSDRPRWIYSILGRGQLEGVLSEDVIVWVDALTDEPTEAPGKTRIYR